MIKIIVYKLLSLQHMIPVSFKSIFVTQKFQY